MLSVALQTVVPPLSTIPTSYSSTRLSIFRILLEHMKPYLECVLEKTKDVEVVAQELLKDQKTLSLLYLASQEVLRSPQKFLPEALNSLHTLSKKFEDEGIDVEDALDIIVEHDMWKLRQIEGNFGRYAEVIFNLIINYPEDADRYSIIYMSVLLLLLAINEANTPEKLRALGEELNRLTGELESYTLTFMIMIEESWMKELNVIATAKISEEIKRVLGID